jgi:signal transduction histidine kinase
MSLQNFFEQIRIFQMLVLALSIFNLVAFLWLAFTVVLNGDRRSWIARLGFTGLGLSAFFFYLHALLISNPLTQTGGLITTDFLWHLIWIPAVGVPSIWFAIGLHYAALININWRKRRPMLLISSGVIGGIILLLLVLYRSTFTFTGTLRLLAYNSPSEGAQAGLLSPQVFLPILFLCYVTFCAIGPWFALGRVNRLLRVFWHGLRGRWKGRAHDKGSSLLGLLFDAFWEDPTDVEVLEEPVLSWHLARPGLFLAALLMVGLTTILGILGISSMVIWLRQANHVLAFPILTAIPMNLFVMDMFATGAVALIILLVGYSIVRHGILIERPLARRGFFEQWRGIVIVATTVAIFVALLVTFIHSNLGVLLLIASLATIAYALFTWRSYTAHDRYIAVLGPFLRGTNVRHWLNTDLQKTEKGLEDLFFHLCEDALAVRWARLNVIAGPLKRSFSYRWPEGQSVEELLAVSLKIGRKNFQPKQRRALPPDTGQRRTDKSSRVNAYRVRMMINGEPTICWILPISDERGPVAILFLGPRQDGGVFTEEDMALAQACGQRILDTLGEHEAMQAVAALLRRRIVDVKLLGAQQRRILHDEILPQMHLALLRLETVRSFIGSEYLPDSEDQQWHSEQVLSEAIEIISGAHRRLAAMMRATAPTAPHRLERDGLMQAIHDMLQQDFQHAFDEVEWCVSEETACSIDEVTPPAIAELIFAAVQEALRNAARHARGSDVHRRLHLTLKASCQPHLEVIVADDGIGIVSASSSTTGTGSGLLTHGALLAIAGGSLTVKSVPGEGVTVRILLPTETLC